jgi:hypothetical protein
MALTMAPPDLAGVYKESIDYGVFSGVFTGRCTALF